MAAEFLSAAGLHQPAKLTTGGNVRHTPVITMRTGVNAVSAGGSTYGWINGNTASLAAGGNVYCHFDLGPDWDQYNWVSVGIAITSGSAYGTTSISGAEVYNSGLCLCVTSGGTEAFYASLVGGQPTRLVRPCGRYITVLCYANATVANGGSDYIRVTAYPN